MLPDLLSALDIVILERLEEEDSFRIVATPPQWIGQFFPEGTVPETRVQPASIFPFLQHFLFDADHSWSRKDPRPLRSGPWTEHDSTGTPLHFEATAVTTHGHRLLMIEKLGEEYLEWHAILQQARERSLQHGRELVGHRQFQAKLGGMLDESEKTRDDLLSILNQLRVPIFMTDAQGCVSFVSQQCQQLLGRPQEQVLGTSWEQVCHFRKEEKALLQQMILATPDDRERIPLHLQVPGGKSHWIEIDVKDDPRDPERKMFFIHDMTEIYDLRRSLKEKAKFHDLTGKSKAMEMVYTRVSQVALVDTTVLIGGETGTGKELIAKAIHFSSSRKNNPFVAVNCAGLTDSLLGSQLFGHKRGAFTGATEDHRGFFETANEGTIFLDEIGDMPLTVQASLLRVLQEKEILRLGESKPRKVNVRVIAATNKDLNEEVARGNFRADLLYRIRVARIDLPPLRERREDIPLLLESFLSQTRATGGKQVQEVSAEAMQRLVRYPWPGNVRELKSAVEFSVIHCPGAVIQVTDLPPEILDPTGAYLPDISFISDQKERVLIALERAQGNRVAAARLLGISRATLYRRLASLGIPTES